MSPTRPMSTGSPFTTAALRIAVNVPASSPDRPTANGPCRLIRPTMSLFTVPDSTIRTTSIAPGGGARRAGGERGLTAEPVELRADLRAAAVHHDRAQPA